MYRRSQLASYSAASEPQKPEAGRFIAVRHKVTVQTSETELPKAWESAAEACRALRCEIVSSSISNAGDSAPSASLSVRVVPEDLKKFFERLGKVGRVIEHATESEDKTAVVIDTEAQVKNLTGFRDSLRAMLAKSSASVKDLVEVERELVKVQTEMDAATTKRKLLANETEKVAVEIGFRARRSVVGTGVFAPIAEAWQSSGTVLSESVAALFTVIVAVIPWLVLIVPGFWLVRKLYRRLFRRRTGFT
jgi:hypothetical protein